MQAYENTHTYTYQLAPTLTSLPSNSGPVTTARVTLHSRVPIKFLTAMEIRAILKRLPSDYPLQLNSPILCLASQPANKLQMKPASQFPPRSPLFVLLATPRDEPTLPCLEASQPTRPSRLRALERWSLISIEEVQRGWWLDSGFLQTGSLVTKQSPAQRGLRAWSQAKLCTLGLWIL